MEKQKIIRAYEISHDINLEKQEKVFALLNEYRAACNKIAYSQWQDFIRKHEQFNKNCDIQNIVSPLSHRYKRCCAYQVNSILKSFLSNVQNKFKDMVYHANLTPEQRKHLFQINRRQLWFHKEHELFTKEDLLLARKIFKRIMLWWRKPDFSKQNMLLTERVAQIIPAEKDGFDFWIKLSSLDFRKQILLPLKTNSYFEKNEGKLCKSVQINVNEYGQLQINLMKEIEPTKVEFTTDKIAIDVGLRTLFALNNGELYGRNFIDNLKKYDNIIVPLQKNLQRQGLKPRSSKRYRELVKKVRAQIKNEVNRTLNRIFRKHKPREIVIENLDFRHQDLSKQMNRLIGNFGNGIIAKKLQDFEQRHGVLITRINPAYSSQTCDSCGYVAKNNRPTNTGKVWV